MEPLRAVKGMNDILPAEARRWQRIEGTMRRVFGLHGYGEVRTPLVEEAALFSRSIGEETDVVSKEMYVFPDRHGKPLALRPEGTASAVRAYIEHGVGGQDPLVRWYYLGAMFRHERPQKGRYRQFHQLGAELFGAAAPEADAELLSAVHLLLSELGLANVTLQLNSIGDDACRPAFALALTEFLRAQAGELCDDCRRRTEANPLRTLDCKVPSCRAVLAGAPGVAASLCQPCRSHFEAVTGHLKALGIAFETNDRLVRGLDYYTRTTFEFLAAGELGSQNTVAAGGRYDKLVSQLGGGAVPAVGFAAGIERLALALGPDAAAPPGPELFIVSLGEPSKRAALALAASARRAGLVTELDVRGGSVKSQLRRADRVGAAFAVVLGDAELASGRAKLKAMRPGGQGELDVALEKLPEAAKAFLIRVDR
ncbi:MAG: histidine--tRNA ligase [Deltaproteobacteria bacterium]